MVPTNPNIDHLEYATRNYFRVRLQVAGLNPDTVDNWIGYVDETLANCEDPDQPTKDVIFIAEGKTIRVTHLVTLPDNELKLYKCLNGTDTAITKWFNFAHSKTEMPLAFFEHQVADIEKYPHTYIGIAFFEVLTSDEVSIK